ncbi:DEAD/DEAH box helicase [Salisediminibacterium selenitireducens]|uniref:SNF2-related protein n=1 Tax=Bacillus selenitireducens (strain ATCC 700615 / DSM 15326 / MLS10) TaxID=439292 RepID=D6Y087_BACIE|nr:DEAD/DEAH box helicase [Salisediminibacterium selenitireducens]ADH98478.1 SNF2-related protein [[Bacillus] selenitireducens MLS10]
MITIEQIEERYSAVIVRRGEAYVKENRVETVNWNEHKQELYAKVKGTENYHLKVFVKDGKIIDENCTCQAYYTYLECKHITAALIAFSNSFKTGGTAEDHISKLYRSMFKEDMWADSGKPRRPVQAVPKMNTDAGQMLIQHVSGIMQEPLQLPVSAHVQEPEPLTLESLIFLIPEASTQLTSIAMELKAGTDRLYKVKDIREFLSAFKHGREYFFTKNFSYQPERHLVSDRHSDLLTRLWEIAENESYFDTSTRYYIRKKQLNIPPAYVSEVLQMVEADGAMTYDETGSSLYELEKAGGQLPLSFSVVREDGVLRLNASSVLDVSLISDCRHLYHQGDLYELTERQFSILQTIRLQLKRSRLQWEGVVHFDRSHEEDFFTHLLPKLELLGPVTLSDDALIHVNYQPMRGEVYLDLTNDYRLTADVAYHYGDTVIRPFERTGPAQDAAKRLVRDTEHEQRIMTVIEQADFRVHGSELYLEEEEAQYLFLFELLPYLAKEADIFYSSSLKNILDTDPPSPVVELNYVESGNYLEAGFELPGVSKEELANIIGAIVEKKRFYRLDTGELMALKHDQFAQVESLVTGMQLNPDELVDGKLRLPGYRSLEAEELLRTEGKARYSRAFRDLLEAIRHPSTGVTPLPEGLNADLRDYQVTGFQWLTSLAHYGFGGVLADDMGLGKTLQAIAYLLYEKEEAVKQGIPFHQALVIAPASLTYNWKNELEKFAPSLSVLVMDGVKDDRIDAFNEAEDKDVVITSYPKVRQDSMALMQRQFGTLILDESQAIKNPLTKVAKAVKLLPAARRFALSGTPVENRLEELWAVFDAVMPGLFPGKKAFNQLSEGTVSRMSRPFILRRLKQDVLTELPDKIESVQYSDLTDDQKALYLAYLERIQGEAARAIASDGFQESRMKILAGLTRLRQLCCHPSLFIEDYKGESGKLNDLKELVANAVENGRRLLIFSQFSSMLTMMKDVLEEEGYSLFYLDGQTPGKDRVDMAERFNQGEKELFLISLKAGGTGLNLPGADLVVLYDLWWNPAVEEQAAGRAHRMGQKKVVQVIRMVSEGTIEEKIHALQQRKRELIDTVIQPGETSISSLSEDDIRELLTI